MLLIAPRAEAATGRLVERFARYLAFAGGIVLVLVGLMVCVSIVGRQFDGIAFFRPVRGDYELVELGTVVAVFAFLPWCQLKRGHVAVDVVVQAMPDRARAFSGFVGDALIAAVAFVMSWRLWAGFGEKFPHGSDAVRDALGMGPRPFFPEQTYELAIPTWIPYSLAFAGSALFFVTALYTAWRSLNWTLEGAERMP
ncbi:TRAP transporter small permease [Roseibacterium sp. SDUM158017]|uniref:TRAP transporter small permease n=1 Tax=Roseicyclus salinarum TaxID=3036773 RepID=UPI0024157E1A|nr:TRAP transporter small permease [Roseibacterium sp. SDUM158017]MDG4647483.1 TRAP transporter small permease [Roseibacterium sp. SDUM158017]